MIARNTEDESVAGAVFYGCDVVFNVNCRELTVNYRELWPYDIPETVFLFNVNFRKLTVNYREFCL